MVKNIFVAILAFGFSFGNPFYVFAEDVVQEVENNDQIQEIVIDVIEGEEEAVCTVENSPVISFENTVIPVDYSNVSGILQFLGGYAPTTTDPDGGNVSTTTNIESVFPLPGFGEYPVVVTATDDEGCVTKSTVTVVYGEIDETEGSEILSCDDVVDTEDLLTYLSQFDGDPNCLETPVIVYAPHFDIFPGQTVNDVVRISLDGVEYTLPTVPNFTLDVVDETTGFLQGTFSFPYNFPNWGDGNNPTHDVPVIILLTFHSAETPTEEPETSSGGGGGGGSSSGFKRNSGNGGIVLGATDEGEVLGESTTSCPVFSDFYRKGDTGEGVKSIQAFLNQHMNAGLAVDGIFGPATEKAVHAFQQKYWEQTIKPWTSVFSSRTTGRWYKTTSAWANVLSGCSAEPVLLEDTGEMYTPVAN